MTAKAPKKIAHRPTDKVSVAARNVWLASLGAYSEVFSYATNRFHDWVAEGRSLEVRVRRTEEETVDDIKGRYEAVTAKAREHWAKMEKDFQRQSSKMVNRLGLPTVDDVNDLASRVGRLDKKVRAMTGTASRNTRSVSPA